MFDLSAAQPQPTLGVPSTPPPGVGNLFSVQNIIFAVAMAGAVLVVWGYRRLAAKPKSPPLPVSAAHDELVEIARLRADLSELGERLAQDLDDRAQRIDTLLARADDAIARLDAAAARAERAQPNRGSLRTEWPEPKPPTLTLHTPGVEHPIPDLVHQRIVDLAQQGLSASEIAARLEHPIGQVELVIALHRSQLTR